MCNSRFIPLSVPNLKGNEKKYIDQAIDDEWVSTGGAFINDFEKAISQYMNCNAAAACQSGTAGLHLSLIAKGIGQGDEVLVPALTFIAAVNPVKYAGAEPVFMDCDDSLCMNMDKVREFCREECIFDGEKLIDKATGRRVSAMLVVHVFGNMADMEKAMDIAREYGLTLIEDATEALGTKYETGKYAGKHAGTIGDIGALSFNGNKIITTGGGGMVISDDEELVAKVKYLSTQAKDDPLYYVHEEIGYNYRMTNLQAAMGLAQLEQIEDFVETKRTNYELYREEGLELLPFRDGTRPNYWFYSYMTERRDELIAYLGEQKIQTRPVWNLICDLKPYSDSRRYKIEKAKYYWEKIVNIPCSTNLGADDVRIVAQAIRSFEDR